MRGRSAQSPKSRGGKEDEVPEKKRGDGEARRQSIGSGATRPSVASSVMRGRERGGGMRMRKQRRAAERSREEGRGGDEERVDKEQAQEEGCE